MYAIRSYYEAKYELFLETKAKLYNEVRSTYFNLYDLDVPEEIRKRPPTTDTYSLPQGQDEFYFSLPYNTMDLCLYGKNHGIPAEDVAQGTGLTMEQIAHVYKDIDTKRSTTRYLHLPGLLVEKINELNLS